MVIKKSGGKIFGASLTTAEQKAMDMEIRRQIAELDAKNDKEIDAIILWILHHKFGFGEIRLKRFHDNFIPEIKALIDRYEMEECDDAWLCTRMLKEDGIDISKW